MPERLPRVSMSITSTRRNLTGSWKYVQPARHDRVAPCNARCPVGIDVEGYLNLLREGKLDEAQDLLLRENPMPAVTGRVCDHPCEGSCNRGPFDEPVAVHAVERMLGDRALSARAPGPTPRIRPERVAIVGSGPAGLACAYHLARFGYGVTIFEAAAQPGGMLRYGIPEYRLPKEVLEREIDRIRALGVEIRCNARVEGGNRWGALGKFDAVFVATGAHVSRPLGIDGEKTAGIRSGLAFLKDVNEGRRPELGARVVVVGGGNTAMDCARTALRLGSDVVVLYRRSRGEMPAIAAEVEEAELEGVRFHFLAAPVEAVAQDGRLAALRCVRMALGEPDASGRRRPVPIAGSEFFLEADTVLSAVGETPELGGFPEAITRTADGVRVDDVGGTSVTAVFAGGDLVEEPRSVAHALGSGKRAAIGIHSYLSNEGFPDARELAGLRYGPNGNVSVTRKRGDDPIRRADPVNEVVTPERVNRAHFVKADRAEDRHPKVARRGFAETNAGLTPEEALEEAKRCFNCGVCNGCEVCMVFCPDLAIGKDESGAIVVALEYCKGCGLCAAECPRGALDMVGVSS